MLFRSDVLKLEDVPDPTPSPGHAVVDLKSIGVNYTDVSSRKGTNPPASFPWTPGREGCGVVTAIGEGVSEVVVGDRVAYAMHTGSYAERQAVPSWLLVRIPDAMDFATGSASLLQGMTRSEEHTSELQSRTNLVCRLLLEKKKTNN